MCLYHISLIYGAHVGISDGNLIVGQVQRVLNFGMSPVSPCMQFPQVVNRLVGAISAVLWMPFSQRFGNRTSYFVSISIGVAASCVILLPMTARLFWSVLRLTRGFPLFCFFDIQSFCQVSICPSCNDWHRQFHFC